MVVNGYALPPWPRRHFPAACWPLAYAPAQVLGCVAGAVAANGMFGKAAVSIAQHHRATPAHLWAEVVATAGLVLVIFALVQTRRAALAPAAVGAYIAAAYFFTSSTSFANPAISIGRMFSDTFAGIAPASVPAVRRRSGSSAGCSLWNYWACTFLYPASSPRQSRQQ